MAKSETWERVELPAMPADLKEGEALRLRVPEGWLVVLVGPDGLATSLAHVPDERHAWDVRTPEERVEAFRAAAGLGRRR